MPKQDALTKAQQTQLAQYAPSDEFASRMSAKAKQDVKDAGISDFRYVSGVKDGSFKVGDIEIGESFHAIIIGTSFVNAYYSGKYNPDNPAPPDCYAVALDEDDLKAFDDETKPDYLPSDPQNLAPKSGRNKNAWEGSPCFNCPNNEFGSDGGGGKLCKNQRKLALLPLKVDGDFDKNDNQTKKQLLKEGKIKEVGANDVDYREILQEGDDEVFLVNVSTTSMKQVRRYVSECESLFKYPFDAVVCRIELVQSEKGNFFEFRFTPIDRVLESEYDVVESVKEKAEQGLTQPIITKEDDKPKAKPRTRSNKRRN